MTQPPESIHTVYDFIRDASAPFMVLDGKGVCLFEAISRFVWMDWFPVMRGTHQMLWCRVRLAGG
jgi:hypothetical protein